jgi:hypothetical protein
MRAFLLCHSSHHLTVPLLPICRPPTGLVCRPAQVWIVKPAAAYCGRGITLHRSSPEMPQAVIGQKGVASKYVDPPFLLDGLKSDIRIYVRNLACRSGAAHPPLDTQCLSAQYSRARLRAQRQDATPGRNSQSTTPAGSRGLLFTPHRYLAASPVSRLSVCLAQVLVTSWHPLTVYQYCDGLARFATQKYTLDDIEGRCAHLTNYSLNKHSAGFVNDDSETSGSKWSLEAFKRRLVLEIGERREAPVPGRVACFASRLHCGCGQP